MSEAKKIKLSSSENSFKALRLKKDKVESKVNIIKDVIINPAYEMITPEAAKPEHGILYNMLYTSECQVKEEDIPQQAAQTGASQTQRSAGSGSDNWDSSTVIIPTTQGRQEVQQPNGNVPFQRQMRIGEKNLNLLAELLAGLDEPEVPQVTVEDGPPIDAGAPQKLVENMIRESKTLKGSFTAEFHRQALIVQELKDALKIEEARLQEVVRGLEFLQKLETNLNSVF